MKRILKYMMLVAILMLPFRNMAQIIYTGKLTDIYLAPSCDSGHWTGQQMSDEEAKALIDQEGSVILYACDDKEYTVKNIVMDRENTQCYYSYDDIYEISDACNNSISVARVVTIIKTDPAVASLTLPNETFKVCSFDDDAILPKNSPSSIRSYLMSKGFHEPSCWSSASYSMMNSSFPEVDGCYNSYTRRFQVSNGCSESVITFNQNVRLDMSDTELTANTTTMDDILVFGCSADQVPAPIEYASQLKESGIELEESCELDSPLHITSTDTDGGLTPEGRIIVNRQYSVTDGCHAEPIFLDQKIEISAAMSIGGRMKTCYFTDEQPPEPEDVSLSYLENQGASIYYTCDKEDLIVTWKTDERTVYAGNIVIYKRIFQIETPYDYIEPEEIIETWKKRSPNVMEFKFETHDCTGEGSEDGQLLITPPEYDEGCTPNPVEESYCVELLWTDKEGKERTLNYPDEEHTDPFSVYDLNGGKYELRIFPVCPELVSDGDEPVFFGDFEIDEYKTEVYIQPWMSFSGKDIWCEMFSHHIIVKDYNDKSATIANGYYPSIRNGKLVMVKSIIREKDMGWNYMWETTNGKFVSACDESGRTDWLINQNLSTHLLGGYELGRDINMLKIERAGSKEPKAMVTFTASKEVVDNMIEKTYTRPAYFGFYNDSYDPNMITGPTGYGNDSIISTKDRIDYKISFENSPDFATAAASRVTINCPLHEKADPKTVRLGQFGFGDFIYEVPELSSHYNNRIDLADTLGVWLDVTAGLDIEKNEVYWIFQSIDPETGVQPNDTTGFLPVNDTLTGCGEGFVSFSITTFEDTKTGDTITERASIVFDENDAIPTNTCTNMFDAVAPTSVLCGDTTGVYSNYVLNFKALAYDDEGGSGIGNVELFVNADKTEYVSAGRMVKDSVSDTLRGSFNIGFSSLYQFVCLATDNVGNKEAFKDSPEFEFVNNNPPTDIFLSNRFFDEDVKIGTLIGQITTTDDQESNEFEYSLVEGDGDDDNSLFRIDDDKLKTNHDFRCGNVYSFRVRIQSKDVNGDSIQKAFYLYANETATPPVTVLNEKLCFGETYTFGGMELSEVGVYYDTLHTVYGCDSVVKLNLIHYPEPVITYYDQPNCEGEDFEYEEFVIPWDSIENNYISSWNRQNDTTLVFKIDVENADKCSDTLWLNMLLHPKKYDSHDITICENGLPFRYGDSIFSEGGQKLVHFTTVDGCDSIVTVNLTVEPTYYSNIKYDTICDNEEYVIFSDTITEPGQHYVMGKTNIHHCDSLVQLRLTVLPTYDKVFEKTVCPTILPMTYEGFDIPVDAVSGEMLRYEAAANGCDSIIHLNLTVRDAATQHNDIYNGWNWYSTYLDLTEIGGLQTLEDSLGNNGEQIKSQYDFVTNTDAGWMGSLTDIENEKMYMIKTNADLDLVAFSCTTEGSEHPITMANGWNWIGYVSRYTMPLETAMAGLDVTPQEGDIIKSYDHGFAAYYADFGGWFGSLTQMQPGAGYMYKSNASNDITLTYPTVTGDMGQRLSMLPTHWNVKNRQFPETMTFIGKITVDNLPATIEEYEVGVFCDNEVRGSGRAILMEGLGTYRLFIQVYGRQGDELTFRLYDHRHGREADATSTQVAYFIPNADYGRITDPYVFKFYTSGNGVDDIEGMSHELTLVPNPAEATDRVLLFCDFTPEERNGLTVEVFNTLGVRVQQTEPTRFPVQLKEITYPGSYTVKVTTGTGRVLVKKLVVTR